MKLERFLSHDEQQLITKSIAAAETRTSGEIRVHLTPRCRGDVVKAATRVFDSLRMYETRRRNGVLIYIAVESRKLAILGDVGINRKVAAGYWDEEIALLSQALKTGRNVEGIVAVIENIGSKLAEHFPYEPDDENELPNDISYEP